MSGPPPRDSRLDRFFDRAVDLLCVGDLFGYFLRANRATIDLLGFTEDELHRVRFLDLVHPDDRRRTTKEYLKLSRGEPTRRLEVRFRDKQDRYHWVAWTAWSDLETGLIYAVGRDVEELYLQRVKAAVFDRIHTQLWAMRTNADLLGVLGAIRDGLRELGVPFDHCGINRIVSGEPPVVRAHSMVPGDDWLEADADGAQILFRAWREGRSAYREDLDDEDPNNEAEIFLRWFGKGVRSVVDVPFSHGTLAVNSFTPHAFDDWIPTLETFARLLSDCFHRWEDLEHLARRNREMADEIARRELAEAELRQAHEVAVEASQSKSAFLANTSHEIRTPINAIMGMAQVLDEEGLTVEQHDYVQTILQASVSLLDIVNDILDLSKIESGHVELEQIPFSPAAVIAEACRTLRVRADEKGIELSASVDESVPSSVTGDPGRLRQILLNLLSNAVKFTDEGSVALSAAARGGGDDWELEIAVADSGLGIPRERQEAIFHPFLQADSSTTRLHGGTGLGLSICRRYVEMMGGQIVVESEPGAGSTFRFTACFGSAAELVDEVEPVEAPACSLDRLRLLLVEDNPLNRKVVHALLRHDGHHIVEAHNGAEAVERCAEQTFDAILMDVQMPEMDGYEATQRIRQAEAASGRRRVPIYALTAHASPGDEEPSRAAGMDDHIAKPLRKERLRELLAGITPAPTEPAVVAAPTDPAALDLSMLEELRDLAADGDFDLAGHVRLFADDTRQRLERLRAAIAGNDTSTAHHEAHTIKGSSREVGATALADLAYTMETQARNAALDGAGEQLLRMESAYESAVKALRDWLDGA
jgi:PAS domain S-box-containing protein